MPPKSTTKSKSPTKKPRTPPYNRLPSNLQERITRQLSPRSLAQFGRSHRCARNTIRGSTRLRTKAAMGAAIKRRQNNLKQLDKLKKATLKAEAEDARINSAFQSLNRATYKARKNNTTSLNNLVVLNNYTRAKTLKQHTKKYAALHDKAQKAAQRQAAAATQHAGILAEMKATRNSYLGEIIKYRQWVKNAPNWEMAGWQGKNKQRWKKEEMGTYNYYNTNLMNSNYENENDNE